MEAKQEMGHLWVEDIERRAGASDSSAWRRQPLGGAVVELSAATGQPLAAVGNAGPTLLSASRATAWVLLASPAVRVNGVALRAGLRVLRDRDHLSIAGVAAFYSSERLPRVEPFPGSAQPCCCPRCKQEIERDAPAVQCPQCGVWHHQSADELPCWVYGETTCTLCDQPSALDASYRWTPEHL